MATRGSTGLLCAHLLHCQWLPFRPLLLAACRKGEKRWRPGCEPEGRKASRSRRRSAQCAPGRRLRRTPGQNPRAGSWGSRAARHLEQPFSAEPSSSTCGHHDGERAGEWGAAGPNSGLTPPDSASSRRTGSRSHRRKEPRGRRAAERSVDNGCGPQRSVGVLVLLPLRGRGAASVLTRGAGTGTQGVEARGAAQHPECPGLTPSQQEP